MIPKRVVLENFLSYGPRTEIAFTDDEPLWVLSGPNGVGKSAVFDAITYCLFAEHRGGGQGHEQLVRHGANGFSVSFEFEFAGIDYRVARNRAGKKATQSVEQRTADVWARVANVDSVADVKGWVERTIGLSHAAFTASVLLPQGKADELLEATPAVRLDLLKKVIGVERFEKLSERVTAARKGKAAALESLVRQRAAIAEVSADELTEAEEEVLRTATAREAADTARRNATAAVPVAKQWVALGAKRDDLTSRLTAADARATDTDAIRTDHARLVELTAVVPVLEKLIPLRATLKTATSRHAEATATAARHRTELEQSRQRAEALRLVSAEQRRIAAELAAESGTVTAEQGRQSSFLTLADEITALRATATGYPATLDADTAAARESLRLATADERAASATTSETSALLKQVKADEAAFDNVEVGVTCSQCRQKVTAEHAEEERRRLTDRVAELSEKLAAARESASTATVARESAERTRDELAKQVTARDRNVERLADQERSLTALGGTTDAGAIRAELARREAQLTDVQQRHDAARHRQLAADAELKPLGPAISQSEAEARQAETDVRSLTSALDRDTATHAGLLGQLPAAWHDTADAAPHVLERDRLTAAGTELRFRDLEQDTTLRSEWEKQRAMTDAEIADIPEAGRVPVADAERIASATEQVFRTRDSDHRAATDRHGDLTRRRTQWDNLTASIVAAETDARVHTRLDTLLGKQKLQRELIRDAEAEIVRLADQTAGKLSGGELSISLAQSEEGDDKAFDLLVRVGDDPTPTGVRMLSGSQKFRVAISVALAIGRFAAGQARPLECVIIDEGFGNLDKDGLAAAAEELNRLKDHLRRIVLVSHQEEFTDRFPVVIRLSKGEHGTVAEPVRQRR